MELKTYKNKRAIWVFIDGKHKKSIPFKYENIIKENLDILNLDKKYLNVDEREFLDKKLFETDLQDLLQEIKTNEIHLFRLIKDSKPIGVRKVYSKNGDRFELCFDNKLNIRCGRNIFKAFPVKLPVAFLNY
jgi:hypothetical protein